MGAIAMDAPLTIPSLPPSATTSVRLSAAAGLHPILAALRFDISGDGILNYYLSYLVSM